MQDTTTALIGHYLDHLDVSGEVIEVRTPGAPGPDAAAVMTGMTGTTGTAGVRRRHRTVEPCHLDTVPAGSAAAVLVVDALERVDRPWQTAAAVARVLQPGGLAIVRTRSAAPGPWHFSADALRLLLADLEVVEQGHDGAGAFCVARLGAGPALPPFAAADDALAAGGGPSRELGARDPLGELRPELRHLTDRLGGLEKLIVDRTAQLDDIAARSKRLERQIERLSSSLPVRAARSVRKGLHTLLK